MVHHRLHVLLALTLCGCGAISDLFGPGVPNPFEGQDTLLVQLRCDAASAAAASNLVGERLGLLDLRHTKPLVIVNAPGPNSGRRRRARPRAGAP